MAARKLEFPAGPADSEWERFETAFLFDVLSQPLEHFRRHHMRIDVLFLELVRMTLEDRQVRPNVGGFLCHVLSPAVD
jgi:hypothetical protein